MVDPRSHPNSERLAAQLRQFSREDVERAIDFTATAGAYAYITQNTQQYVRDVEVFNLLGQKFKPSGMFANSENAFNWLNERMAVNPDNVNQLLRRLQGDGAGEVDAMRQISGSLQNVFSEVRYATDAAGQVTSNVPGIDLERVNRFTGEVVERIQVKTNWSSDPQTLKQTLTKFLESPHYSEDVTLAGPKELIEIARSQGVPNRLLEVGDTAGNKVSGERLAEMVSNKDAAVEGVFTLSGVAERVGGGALVGAGVAVTISGIKTYLAYKRGEIPADEAFYTVGVDAARGAVTGAALGGASLVFPPGLIGIGIGVVVGAQIRGVVDIAFGRGAYEDILNSMGAVTAAIEVTAAGVAVVERTTSHAHRSQQEAYNDLVGFAESARDTNAMLAELRARRLA